MQLNNNAVFALLQCAVASHYNATSDTALRPDLLIDLSASRQVMM